MKEPPDDLVSTGQWGSVRHAMRQNGTYESKEWLDAQTIQIKASLDPLFRKIAAFGKISNKELFRNLDDGIWEFKRGTHRILCFQHEKCWRLTHYYSKGGKKKCPPAQIEHAKTIRTEYFQRLKLEAKNE